MYFWEILHWRKDRKEREGRKERGKVRGGEREWGNIIANSEH
jgi:hypothetical protein